MATTTLNFLITDLRVHLGDADETALRYTDAWLLSALIMSVKALGRWWNFKYLLNSSNEAYRNSNITFLFSEPPVIEVYDERLIVLMASIIIKEGSLENSSWSVGSWKDAEIAYSNIEGSKAKQESLKKDWAELTSYISSPTRRLATPKKKSLPGYLNNPYEMVE